MAIRLISSSAATIAGTNRSDFILASGYANATDEIFPETLANRIRARGGNDLVIGDVGAIFGNVGTRSNNSIATAVSIDDVRFWTNDENPLVDFDAIPHISVLSETSVGEKEYFAVTLTAGQYCLIDLDFGGVIGMPPDMRVRVFDAAGESVAGSERSTVRDGGLGSYSFDGVYDPFELSPDPLLAFPVTQTGLYYIELSSDVGSTGDFDRPATFMMTVSAEGHAVYDRTMMAADIIGGDEGNDLLLGVAGDDVIRGGAGDDVIDGGSGRDRIEGGDGNDTLFAGSYEATDDEVRGGDGNDVIWAALSGRYLAEEGNDHVVVADWFVGLIDGGGGRDLLEFEFNLSAMKINLATGATFSPGARIRGFEDVITWHGDDQVTGTAAANRIQTSFGDDTISAAGGDDFILPAIGNDTIDGGKGFDTVSYEGFSDPSSEGVVVSLAVADRQLTGFGNQKFTSIEGLFGSNGRDRLTGSDGADRLDGGFGADLLTGGGGRDVIVADRGDFVDGGAGADTLIFAPRGELGASLRLSQTTTQQLSNVSGDTLRVISIENVVGSIGDDRFEGSAQANMLEGGAGFDRMDGREGDDVLVGGADTDALIGGTGLDIFRFGAGDAPYALGNPEYFDVVADFSRADGDRIDLSGIDADTTTAGRGRFSFIGQVAFSGEAGELRYSRGDGQVTIEADTDGDANPDIAITLLNLQNLREGDFLLGAPAAHPLPLPMQPMDFAPFATMSLVHFV